MLLAGLAERDELSSRGGVSVPGVSAACMMLYHGWLAATVGGMAPPSAPSSSSLFSSSSSSSKGLEGGGGVLGLEPSPLREDREPVFGGVAKPAGGGGGAFFFLVSDWTKASQGGSLGLWVPLDRLDSEDTQIWMEGSHRWRQQKHMEAHRSKPVQCMML